MKMGFSIVIPTLNEEKAIPILLGSLAKQSFKDFEVIIVDGKSSDETTREARKFKEKMSLQIIFSDIKNPGYQRNLGVKAARGEFILFLDADGYIDEDYLSLLHQQIQQINSFKLGCTLAKPDSGDFRDTLIVSFYNFIISLQSIRPGFNTFGMVIDKELFLEVGGFNPKLIFAEDSDLVLRLAKKGIYATIFKQPRIVFSNRRFRKDGYLNTIIKLLILNLRVILFGAYSVRNANYKMGGL